MERGDDMENKLESHSPCTFVVLEVGHGDKVVTADGEVSDGVRVGAWQDPLLEGVEVVFLPVV